MRRVRCLWFLLFVCYVTPGAAQRQAFSHELSEPTRPAWIAHEAVLNVPVSLNVTAKPLRNVLAALAQHSGIRLETERALGEYRVSIHIKDQSLKQVMLRLLDLYGHGELPNRWYEWSKITEAGKSPLYYLQRDHHAREQEQALLDIPRQTCLRWLRELRTYIRLPREAQDKFEAECPCLQASIKEHQYAFDGESRPLGEAFSALTDSQIDDLVRDGQIELPGFTFSPEAEAVLQSYGNIPPGPPSKPIVVQLENAAEEDASGTFFLHVLPGNKSYCSRSFVFDTLRQLTGHLDDQEMQLPPPKRQGPVIDLMAHVKSISANGVPKMPLEKALGLLARESDSSIYAELFPKWPIPIEQTPGTPEQLLNVLCARAGYVWRKIGNDYLIYSRSWAQDRNANIPQSLLDRWLANYARNKRCVLTDLLEMAVLRDEQVKNLHHWLNVQSALSRRNIGCLRLMAKVPLSELPLAYDPQGVTLNGLDSAALEIVRKEFPHGAILPLQAFIQRDPDRGPIRDAQGNVYVHTGVTITLRDQSGITKQYGIIEPFAPFATQSIIQ